MSTLRRRIDDPRGATRTRTSRRWSSIATATRSTSRARRFRYVAAGMPAAPAWRHVGLYVYRRECLLRLAALPPTALEHSEALEQLRALEHGIRIKAVETALRLDRRGHAGGPRARAPALQTEASASRTAPLKRRHWKDDAADGTKTAREIHPRDRRRRLVARQGAGAPRRSARSSKGTATRSPSRSSTRTSTSIPAR